MNDVIPYYYADLHTLEFFAVVVDELFIVDVMLFNPLPGNLKYESVYFFTN